MQKSSRFFGILRMESVLSTKKDKKVYKNYEKITKKTCRRGKLDL